MRIHVTLGMDVNYFKPQNKQNRKIYFVCQVKHMDDSQVTDGCMVYNESLELCATGYQNKIYMGRSKPYYHWRKHNRKETN